MLKLKSLPTKPGVYLYHNSVGEVIYVGKAINLRSRVSQYFQSYNALGPKTKTLVSQIASIKTQIVNSEIEALILEASLIKKYHPKYNSLLKDDKSYLYITISHDSLPTISTARSTNLPSNTDTFGPFPDSLAVKTLLRAIRKIFPYYSKKHSSKPCLYCHLHLCPGPNPNIKIYRQTVTKIKKILTGDFKILQRQLKKEMDQFSRDQNFEMAMTTRDQLQAINYIVSGWHHLSSLFAQINLPSDRSHQAIDELKTLLHLGQINRLECFDISQLGSQYFVGSMSVWQDGRLAPDQYRQFKIKNTFGTVIARNEETWQSNDPLMIREVVYRRLRHSDWGTPDLILVDGGKPQVSAISIIDDLPSTIKIIGLAKKLETIVIKNQNDFTQINLPANSSALNLLKLLRNEAHRFANRYRRQLMSKSLHDS